ncbi:branched-chain amino acid ABC transporter ATP-binding protein/permease [Sinomonas atrocyanea]|uniref:branched-chain amino acid ABC transporter ATP-binding protein/permease n=1 Tax=Sinomonas atrocyanea TaxID=37927 RepID=UPI00277F29B5|nr:ATP-binding cassette domain-containing protein [Sinomonas atrocyanea]MDQ0259535.1 branched-chain amino acid transport system permease protein [Sinomonas atrocyanea]MDR6623206.1 branched-chain amino acid transport system permease protein [Sinomonas atrocyanea]
MLAIAPYLLPAYPLALLTLSLAYGLFAFGLDLSWGRAGVISIGHAAFFGLGAYGSAIAVNAGVPAAAGVVAALILSAAIALGIARVGLGRKALASTMAVLTLALTLLAEQIARSWLSVTNGSNGLFVPAGGVVDSYYRTAAVVLAAVLGVWFFVLRGPLGRRLLAVRVNEQRTEHLGVDPYRAKTYAFVLSALVATVAGATAAPVIGLVSPSTAGIVMSTQVLVWLAVGGRGTILGAFLGAGIVTVGQEYLGDAIGSWYLLAMGVIFILVVRFAPGGLVGLLAKASRTPVSRSSAQDTVIPGTRLSRTGTQGPSAAAGPGPSPRSEEDWDAALADLDPPALNLRDVTKSFGPVPVVRGVTLEVPRGQIVCLIGPNGAGKTTLLNLIAGDLPLTRGQILLRDREVTSWSAHHRAALGLGRLFQIPSLYQELTPAQNMAMARTEAFQHVDLPAELERFTHRNDVLTQDLPLADQRALELAMSISWGPEIVLLDEPAAGLSHEDSVGLAQTLRRVNRMLGCTLVIVEHDMDIVRQLADRVVVLADGQVLVDGQMDEVSANADVRNAYLGAV